MFSFIRNCQTVFQNNCTILHAPQQCMSDPVSLSLHQHFAVSIFTGFIMIFICSLYRFNLYFSQWCWTCSHANLPSGVASTEKCLFVSFVHFLIGLLIFLLLSLDSSSYNVDTSPLSDIRFATTFSVCVSTVFSCSSRGLPGSKKVLILMRSCSSVFGYVFFISTISICFFL